MPEAFAFRASELALELVALDPEQVVEGVPEVSELVLWTSPDGTMSAGVWQITEGVVTDVEADEVFVVVSGRATVEIEGGPTLALEPGVVGRLQAGDRTVWRVHETLRKVFQVSDVGATG